MAVNKRTLILHLFLHSLQPVVGGRQTIAIWRKSGACVGFDQRQWGLVLLSGHLQQKLKQREHMHLYYWPTQIHCLKLS